MNMLMVGLTTVLFMRGMQRVRRTRWQLLVWWSGIITLVIAFAPPLETAAHDLFTAHMIQHLLLMLITPPLLVLAQPIPPLLWGIPTAIRQWLIRLRRSKRLQQMGRLAIHPLSVGALHSTSLWLWHLPNLYDAALRTPLIHTAEHLSFFVTGLLFWWCAMHGRALGVLSIFALAMQSSLLGALLAFATTPLYSEHLERTAVWRISALTDQQLAGVIMWIPAGMIYTVAALGLLSKWLSGLEAHRISQRRRRQEVHDAI